MNHILSVSMGSVRSMAAIVMCARVTNGQMDWV